MPAQSQTSTPITLVGNLALDITVFTTASPQASGPREDYPADVRIEAGGSVYNHARAHASLGVPAHIVSLYADDAEGHLLTSRLESAGIPGPFLAPLLPRNHKTVLIIDPAGDKTIHTCRASFPPIENVTNALAPALTGRRHVHIAPNPWSIPLACHLPPGAVLSADLHVGFDLEPYPGFLPRTGIVFFSGKGVPDIPARIAGYLAPGPALVICTDAGRGCHLATSSDPSAVRTFPAVSQDEPVIDSAGAGDVFAATFLHYYHAGMPLDTAVHYAHLQAGHSCTRKGLSHLHPAPVLDHLHAEYGRSYQATVRPYSRTAMS